ARTENAYEPKRNVSQQSRTAEKATGKRAAQSCTPKMRKEIAINQYLRGDFSRYAMPFRRAVTQSPESSMLRAICACTASTSSIKDGGLMMQPRKTSAATARTI